MISFLMHSMAAGALGGVMVSMALLAFEMTTGINITNMTKGVGFAIGGAVLGPVVGFFWLLGAEIYERARGHEDTLDEDQSSNVHKIRTTGTGERPPQPRR